MAEPSIDVAIVGGGLAGSSLAAVLSRRGIDAVLIDPHAAPALDFRAEKLSWNQLVILSRLQLLRPVMARATRIGELAIARFGKVVETRRSREYGIDYAALVDAIRTRVPAEQQLVGRVAAIAASADRQIVTLADGRVLSARVVVLATGLGQTLLGSLGIRRVPVSNFHCLAVGFDLAVPGRIGDGSALTIHGLSTDDRSAYLTIFPIGGRQRANLFAYRRHDEAWARAFRDDPRGGLLDLMPGLRDLLPGFSVVGPCVLRPIHLHATEGAVRDGVVLIGDAFATTCPTGGTGVDKVLTDVDRLAAHLPSWLATPGMDATKIARFYADPAKRACDRNAVRVTAYARGMAIDPGLAWTARRYRNFYAQKVLQWARGSAQDAWVRRGAMAAVAVAGVSVALHARHVEAPAQQPNLRSTTMSETPASAHDRRLGAP